MNETDQSEAEPGSALDESKDAQALFPDSLPPDSLSPEALARAKLVSETAKINWRDLQRFFANGTAMFVAPDLDLVEAAYQISVDNAEQVKSWQAEGLLDSVTDQQAIDWLEANAEVWSVVVRPWVLVQLTSNGS